MNLSETERRLFFLLCSVPCVSHSSVKHMHTRMHARTHTHARTHAHAHTYTHIHTYTNIKQSASRVPCLTAIEEDWGETCTTWTSLQSWWGYFTRPCSISPLLQQSWRGFLQSMYPSLHRITPTYLTLVTSCNFRLFMLISTSMFLCLWSWSCSFLCWLPFHMPLLQACWWGLEVSHCCCPLDWCMRNLGCIWACHSWWWTCDGHGVFPAWSSLGTSLTVCLTGSFISLLFSSEYRVWLLESMRMLCIYVHTDVYAGKWL